MEKLSDIGCMVNVPKFQTIFCFYSQIKSLSGVKFRTCLQEQQTGKTLIKQLLQKQSDLGLPCLSKHFCQATSV